MKYFIEAFTIWTLSVVPSWKRTQKCNVFIFVFNTACSQ
jgi:hypothetical protein